jgi:LmbE family N-acetylglucosaminyl deacetylase
MAVAKRGDSALDPQALYQTSCERLHGRLEHKPDFAFVCTAVSGKIGAMTNDKEFVPNSAMSIHAHPDDQDFSIAGTLAKWAKAGCNITSVIITSGDSGSNDPSKGAGYKSELARLREAEQRAANEVLGIGTTVFLRYPDGELVASLQLRKDLTRLIRRHRPEVVLTGDPSGWFYGNEYINHPDHRAAAEAATYAVFPSAGTRMIFTDLLDEGLPPHNVKRLFIHGHEKADTWIDITDTLQTKITALKKHVSQVDTHDVDKWIMQWAEEEGKDKGLKYAESYLVMILEREEVSDAAS